MSDHAGPPTLRQSPKALTFGQGEPGIYEARSAAWTAYWNAKCVNWTPLTTQAEKNGFFAGWEARGNFKVDSQ